MSQTYQHPTDDSSRRSALTEMLPASLDALRSLFSGDEAPVSPVAYMWWFQPSSQTLWQRNSLNTTWLPQRRREVTVQLGALAARTWRCLRAEVPIVIVSAALLPSATTSGSSASTTEWTFMLRDQSNTLNLFSATPSTATTVAGVGGGELSADAAAVLTPNQNRVVAANSLVYFDVGVSGSPTAVADCALVISYYELGT